MPVFHRLLHRLTTGFAGFVGDLAGSKLVSGPSRDGGPSDSNKAAPLQARMRFHFGNARTARSPQTTAR